MVGREDHVISFDKNRLIALIWHAFKKMVYKVYAEYIEDLETDAGLILDYVGLKFGGGGGSRTRVRKHSTQASTCFSRILSLASCDSSRRDAQSASPLNFADPAAGAPDQLSR